MESVIVQSYRFRRRSVFRQYGLGQTFLGDYGSHFILEHPRLFKMIMA